MYTILEELRALDLGRPALRRFGLVVGGVFLAIALFLIYRAGWQPTTGALLTGIPGALLVVGGAAAPALLRPVYRIWMGLAFAMGFVMTRVLLAAVFFGLVTPIGLVRRLLGRDPMRRCPSAGGTYWIARAEPPDREAMTRPW